MAAEYDPRNRVKLAAIMASPLRVSGDMKGRLA
jgi:hypothetical protein